jgi:hypothetical protein
MVRDASVVLPVVVGVSTLVIACSVSCCRSLWLFVCAVECICVLDPTAELVWHVMIVILYLVGGAVYAVRSMVAG